MKNIMKLEFKKIFSKTDVMLMFGVLILAPLLLAFCMVNNVAGINFGGAIAMDGFGILIWTFLKYLFVLYLVPIYVACCFLGKEVETRSINIMLSNQKRGGIIAAKVLTYVIVITVFYALFMVVSAISYQIFVTGTEYALPVESSVLEIVFIYAFQWLEMIFILLVSVVFCCVVKGNAALLLGMLVVILQRVLANLDGIKRILPYYISDVNSFGMIPADKFLSTNMMSVVIYGVILLALILGTAKIWKGRDF